MAGRVIAHYEILETLGEGGMGVVYKARDTKLDRLVAIKVLQPDRITSEERKLRFIQEAKAASALNHPNIVTIYEIGCADGADYMVMEFVAGRPLDRAIPHGGMKIADLLKYSIPIADALACAHAAGIVHRDLKPGNIMIADDGQVKLFDFGLAKLSDLHDASDAELTRSASPHTEEGRILGTVSYMSPEQAEARKVDARSDIFSFGAVMYEMATGQRAFIGRSKISTLAAVLQSDPMSAAGLRAALPRDLEKIIHRCLRKDPALRYQSAADLKISLADLLRDIEAGVSDAAPMVMPPPGRHAMRWIAALVVGVALGVAWGWWSGSRGERRIEGAGPVAPLTTYSGSESEPALSPDGKQVAFVWDGVGRNNFDVYVRLVDGGDALRLTTDPAEDHAPAWSPDGRQLAFRRGTAIYLIPALGGVERKLVQFAHGSLDVGPLSWSPDGKFLAFSGAEDNGAASIWMVSADSGEHRRFSTPPTGYLADISPAFSPDGKRLAFIRERDFASHAVVLEDINRDGSSRGREHETTNYDLRIEGAVWQPDGHSLILTIRQGGLRSGLFRLTPGGTPERLGIDSDIVRWPSLSRTGNRLAYEKRHIDINIYRMDGPGPEGGPRTYEECHVAAVINSTADDIEPQISPDGRRLAFNSDRLGFFEIHVANVDGSKQVALTTMGPTAMGSPRWSPDGQMIVFDRYAKGHSWIYAINAEGGKPRQITNDAFADIRPSFSHDGKWIYFSSSRTGRDEIWRVPVGGGAREQLTFNGGNEAFESADGKLLYYVNSQGLWSKPLGGGESKLVVPEVTPFLYSLAGRSVYYGVRSPQAIWVLRTDTGRKFEYVRFPKTAPGFQSGSTGINVSADERSIVFSQTDRQESDLMLVENFR